MGVEDVANTPCFTAPDVWHGAVFILEGAYNIPFYVFRGFGFR